MLPPVFDEAKNLLCLFCGQLPNKATDHPVTEALGEFDWAVPKKESFVPKAFPFRRHSGDGDERSAISLASLPR
jgi:hypothetical protein